MTKLEIAKKITKTVVGFSVGYTTGNIIGNNIGPAQKPHHLVEAWVGSTVIGLMAADAAENWIDKKIDEIVDAYKTARSPK